MQRIITLATLLVLGLSLTLPVEAKIGGVVGRTTSGCSSCHTGGLAPTVSINGPTSLFPGSVGTYTVTVQAAPGALNDQGFGLNFAATGGMGTFGAGAYTKISYNEVLHNGVIPMTNGVGTATFTWKAPVTTGIYTINGVANAVNGDGITSGDKDAFAAPLDVTVLDVTTTTTLMCFAGAGGAISYCYDKSGAAMLFEGLCPPFTNQCPSGWLSTPPPTCAEGATVEIVNYAWTCVTTTTTETTTTTATTTSTTSTTLAGRYKPAPNRPSEADFCGYCHGLTIGKYRIADAPYAGAPTRHKPAGMGKSRWTRIIKKMSQKEGCPVDANAAAILARYYASLGR